MSGGDAGLGRDPGVARDFGRASKISEAAREMARPKISGKFVPDEGPGDLAAHEKCIQLTSKTLGNVQQGRQTQARISRRPDHAAHA